MLSLLSAALFIAGRAASYTFQYFLASSISGDSAIRKQMQSPRSAKAKVHPVKRLEDGPDVPRMNQPPVGSLPRHRIAEGYDANQIALSQLFEAPREKP